MKTLAGPIQFIISHLGLGKVDKTESAKLQFVSYPKSGRTWIRYMFTQMELESQIYFHHDDFGFSEGARPAHNFDLERRLEVYSKVEKLVYLERDPRDVMVSMYFQITGRFKEEFGYTGTISEFLRDDYFGAHNLNEFRKMWQQINTRLGFCTITYEECHQDTEGTLMKLLAYYGLEVDAERLCAAVGEGAFDKMKQIEQSGTFKEPWLNPRNGSPKVRQGKVGGYMKTLSEGDIVYLNRLFEIV